MPLVHFSTDYVFDGSGGTPWREEDRSRPLSSYGRSKWEGEKAIQASGAPQLIKGACEIVGPEPARALWSMVPGPTGPRLVSSSCCMSSSVARAFRYTLSDHLRTLSIDLPTLAKLKQVFRLDLEQQPLSMAVAVIGRGLP